MEQELTSRLTRIELLLTEKFEPEFLLVEDESARHAGHAGAGGGSETHVRIEIRSRILAEMSRIEAHRAINEAVAGEFATGLHALAIKLSPPAGS